ncbi:YkyA family protein [[Brevibacterium] frigoritolerans]|uniref:YkyA family protein n=1 Tax=Peribacillus frigoritolerans TaxID=450367 RepID=A0A941FLK4_9BACI|nr:YkyA family protein [Peribacillus frigoritolerans]
MDELQVQIEKINTSYTKVLKANEEFNALTENQIKKESFYDSSGIEMADSTN